MKWLEEIVYVIDYVRALPWVGKLLLAGHSQGGLLTVLAGEQRPDVLDGLIPLSPGFSIPDEGRAGICFGQRFDPNHIPDVIHLSSDHFLKSNYFQVSQKIYPDTAVDAYTGPVCIIHGVDDEVIPISVSRRAAQRYHNCHLEEIPGDDHVFHHHQNKLETAFRHFLIRMGH